MAVSLRTGVGLIIVMAAVAVVRPAAGTEPLKVSDLDVSKPTAAATVERICDQAVENIARRYNLNDAQTAVTHRIMTRDVAKFLKEHEEVVWPVIRELLARQLQPPESPEDLQRIGKVARELAKLANDAILRANEEWRQVLTDEQKRMHDFDLAEMEKTFSQIDRNFAEWEQGKASEKSIFGPPKVVQGGPPRPNRPPDGELPGPTVATFKVGIFDTFVEEFIKDYELDAAQIEAARSILKEFKAKADDFKSTKKAEFAKIEAARNAALAEGDYATARKKDAEHKELLEPAYQLFAQMEGRLRNLLTTAQVERYAAKNKTTPPQAKKPEAEKKASPEKPPPKKTASKKAVTPKPNADDTKAAPKKNEG